MKARIHIPTGIAHTATPMAETVRAKLSWVNITQAAECIDAFSGSQFMFFIPFVAPG